MTKLKNILGITLIILAVAGLVYWEMDGRERLLTDAVLVAKQDIPENTLITENMITRIGVTDDSKIKGALGPNALHNLMTKKTKQFIPQNAQLSENFFYADDFYLRPGESIFVIKPEWISMVSSSIRQGDKISLYSEDGMTKIGTFTTAFVKDAAVREVKNSVQEENGLAATAKTSNKDNLLSRTDATSVVTHIEIIATLMDYKSILQQVSGASPKLIMIIQEKNQRI